MEVLTPKRQRV